MSSLDPSGPAQPSKDEAYNTAGNPVTTNPAEDSAASKHGTHNSSTTDSRGPSSGSAEKHATPTSVAQGVRSSGPANEREARATEYGDSSDQPQNENVDAEQLAPLAEGKVADAVQRKSGTQRHGNQQPVFDDYGADLEKKKAEQAADREAIQSARKAGQDVDGGGGDKRSGVEVD